MFQNLKKKMFFCEPNSLHTHFTNKVNLDDVVSACQGHFSGLRKLKSERSSSFTEGI